MSRPSNEQIVAQVAGCNGVGPAGLLAANNLGLITQVPAVEIYALSGPRPPQHRHDPFRTPAGRPARRTQRLRPHQVALLEVLDAWTQVIDVARNEAMRDLAVALDRGEVDARRLVKGASDEPPAARERLRTLLDVAGHPDLAAQVQGASKDATPRAALRGLTALPVRTPTIATAEGLPGLHGGLNGSR